MTQLQQKHNDAQKFLSDLQRKISAEKREAEREISVRYAIELSAAQMAVVEAEKAVRDEIDATSSHPWDGKRVFRTEKYTARWGTPKEKRDDGIVEVVRQSSAFPDNLQWSRPKLGHVIVRKLKKDGTTSKQFYTTYGKLEEVWTLAE